MSQRSEPKSSPVGGAEIEGCFFLAAVQFLQTCKDFSGGDRNERGAVTEKYEREAALKTGEDREHQHGKTSNDPGKNERKENEAAKHGFAGKVGTVEGQSGEKTERKRKHN